jgi:hypothetical protein
MFKHTFIRLFSIVFNNVSLLIGLFFFFSFVAKAQYGNEWIDYSQRYYFLKVTQEGIYRIDQNTLINSGIPTNIDPRRFQVFGRGVEIPVYVQGESDGVFDAGDFIEFYAQPNDGWLDSIIYDTPSNQPNPYYSVITDTAYYYLTWNNSTNNLRVQEENDINYGAYTPANYFFREQIYKQGFSGYSSDYYFGEVIAGSVYNARYSFAAGWLDAAFTYGQTRSANFSTPHIYTSGPAAKLTTVVTSQSNPTQTITDHHLKILYNNVNLLFDTLLEGYTQIYKELTLNNSFLLSSTSINFRAENDLSPAPPANTRMAIAYAKLRYPQQYNFEGQSSFRFIVPNSAQAKTYMDAVNFSATSAVLYDVTNGKRIVVQNISGNFKALIPNAASGEKTCFISSTNNVVTLNSLIPVKGSGLFTNYSITSADYLIITHSSLLAECYNYALYRNSKGHTTIVVDIEELYHQFGYGVRKHPWAIRGFAKYALQNWSLKPEYLFLVGKSVHARMMRNNLTHYNSCLVPSLGNNSSDVLLTSGLSGNFLEPALATGRLAAKTTSDVINYYNKIVHHENPDVNPAEWMKYVAHFCGGTNQAEQQMLLNYLNGYKATIQDTLFGASVIEVIKNVTQPIQMSLTDSIRNLVNNGVSLMTFFGHAAGSSFDINLDPVETYSNFKKYPLILANSCFVGDVHQTGFTTSEDWVLTPNKGAIGFIASVGAGLPPYLNIYSGELYKNFAYKNYHGAVGKSIKSTIGEVQYYSSDAMFHTHLLEMTLHGDPALKLHGQDKPDLMLAEPRVFFSPGYVSTALDSFTVNVVVTNLGRATAQQYITEVIRKFQDGTTDTLIKTINGAFYKDTVVFKFPTDLNRGGGLNTFYITADITGAIDELNENNNFVVKTLFINSDDLFPVYPYKFAVVPKQGVTLKASTADPFAPSRFYRIELDTTDLFNSPVKQSTVIYSSGGVVTWTPSLLQNMPDSMVYFWRTSPDSISSNNSFKWKESSFQYIPDKSGWGQAHHFQFKDDFFYFINYLRNPRVFAFDTTAKDLSATNIGNPVNSAQTFAIGYSIEAQLQDYATCGGSPGIYVAVIDSVTLKPWLTRVPGPNGDTLNPNNNFGNANDWTNCRSREEAYFVYFINNPTQMNSLVNFLNNTVPCGNYVLAWSVFNPLYSQWPGALHSAFQSLGAPDMTSYNDSLPFIFFGKKCYPNTADFVLGDSSNATITLNQYLKNSIPYGTVTSTIIGPAKKWNSIHMRQYPLEINSADSVSTKIYGIDANGIASPVYVFQNDSIDYLNLNSLVDANIYPYLKLELYKRDDVLRTAPQLNRWQVLYDPVPEAALSPAITYSYHADTIHEGDIVKMKIAVKNISEIDMDSLNIQFFVDQPNGSRNVVQYGKHRPLKADSVLVAELEFNSKNYRGQNTLWIEVNPKDNNWQLEQYHFNNIGYRSFFVIKDNINPILDVTFDGTHIINGDIVSPSPLINIKLKDENKFLALNDTSKFRVYIKDPNGLSQRIYFTGANGNEQMRFYPAQLPKNSCRIEYKGDFKTDGMYELRVQASDMSDNVSGDADYSIQFEVINKSTITEVLNYPNPFSTSTRFVFTLTGSQIPSDFKIQILTVTGKVVKELFLEDLGTIRIGRNITEYAWDGTDNFGDRLANGVYLYRVVTKINGQDIEKRNTNADQFFHKGFGKMYLMR